MQAAKYQENTHQEDEYVERNIFCYQLIDCFIGFQNPDVEPCHAFIVIFVLMVGSLI